MSIENRSDQEPADDPSGNAPVNEKVSSEIPSEPPQDDVDEDLPEYEPLTPDLVEDEAIRGDFMLRWAIVLLAFMMASTRIAETATLVHVKSGQYLASHGILPPSTDVFSYTTAERPWTNLSWLFDLLLAGCYAIAGGMGLSILKAILVAVTFGLVVNLSSKKTSTWGSSICAAIALLACHTSMTAQPEIVTLLGLATTCWILQRWKEGGSEKRIWALVPLFLLWSNLDPRMFLGLVMLLLYGVGDLLGGLLNRPSLTGTRRKQFQAAVGVSFLASMVNPFGWHALLSPIRLYASEYPAFREFLAGVPISMLTVRYYTLADEGVWSSLGHSGIAAVVMFAVATVMMVLNHRRLDPGHVLIYFGFAAFAFSSVEQLPAAALVFSVLAALNGQSWYQASFSQEYTVKPRELLFSRGGRVLTVLAFSGMAIMAGFGWLRPPQGGVTGYGFDYMLQKALNGLQAQSKKTFSDRAFNFYAHQGDMLIWVGQKPFIDGRLGLYYGVGEDNLLELHKKTRTSLRIQHRKLLGGPPKQAEVGGVGMDDWKPVFDKYQITHAMPRLTSTPVPDYGALMAFILSFQDWQLTDLSGAAAVFHRIDRNNRDLMKFIEKNRYNFVDRAFREESPSVKSRTAWVAPPDFYDRKLRSVKKQLPEQIQLARHLNVMVRELSAISNRFPLSDIAVLPAMAFLAIRNAQQGLDENPSSAEGYFELGNAYRFLAAWNQGTLMGKRNWQGQGVRFFQALYAYNQTLVADPNHPLAHARLFELYNSPGFFRLDLAIRELDALGRLIKNKSNLSQRERRQKSQTQKMRAQMQEQLNKVHQAIDEAATKGATPLQLANLAYRQYKCPLSSLKKLEEKPELVFGNPAAQLLQLTLLLETGRIEDAYQVAVQLEQLPEGVLHGWRMIAAAARLANAEYEETQELWKAAQNQIDAGAMSRILTGLPPRMNKDSQLPWPTSMTAAVYNYAVNRAGQMSSVSLDMAFAYLESGDVKAAAEKFQQALKQQPNSSARGMVTFYLSRLTGGNIDPVAPANRVPVIFADGTGTTPAKNAPDSDQKNTPASADQKKN